MPKPKLKIDERAQKFFAGEIVKANEEERTIVGVASHESVDRDGDVIKQDGWDLKNLKKNPVMLWGHDYRGLPIAKIIKTWVEGKKLMFKAKFAGVDQAHLFADTVFQMMRDGFLKAFSVGFIPKELRPNEKTGGYFIDSAELLEISVVTVPCHPGAIVQSVKSLAENPDFKEDEIVEFLKMTMIDENPTAEGGGLTPQLAEKAVVEGDNELSYQLREVSEFEEESLITREFQTEPAIFGIFGKLKNNDSEELNLQLLRFPKTDWDFDDVKTWVEENKDELANKKYESAKGKVHFLIGLLSEKHDELKSMRKFFAAFSEATGVERTADEMATIKEIGLKVIGLLKTIDLLESKTKKKIAKPEVNPPAAEKARTADDVESDLFDCLAGK